VNNNESPNTREPYSSWNKHQEYNQIDLGDVEYLSEDDILQELRIVGKVISDEIMDCFWEAEITDLCKEGNFWYTKYRDYFSEHGYDNYSKYLCFKGDSGFNFCKEDSCKGCKHIGSKKVLNEQYVLWQKYVQPIELDEYFGAKA
jgi:hypothetical protein